MPRGVLGMNASMFKGYLRYIANRRATQIGLDRALPERGKPVPVDERNDRPEEGAQLFRDPRHRLPDWWRAVVGLKPSRCIASASERSRFAGHRARDTQALPACNPDSSDRGAPPGQLTGDE